VFSRQLAGTGEEELPEDRRAVVYCVVPRELAKKLHEPLRRHFRDDPSVRVIVERRANDRRSEAERRSKPELGRKRAIRSTTGRRVADRRAPTFGVDAPALPRQARAHAERLAFVERLEPGGEQLEDRDTDRLVMSIQAGEGERFAELYMRYFERVYSYLKIALRDSHEAEDLTQQVFMKALQALPRYERRGRPFRAWLFSIVRNTVLTELQKRSRVELVQGDDLDAAGHTADGLFHDDLRALGWISDSELLLFVERLPHPQQQVLLLRYMLDLTHEETASVLGLTPNQVRKMQQRAFSYLGERLTAIGRRPLNTRERDTCMRPLRQVHVLRERRFALRD
jgi:RNA polymerase sigma-70 factor (ECF subfamily)